MERLWLALPLLLATLTLSGCEAIKTIFNAGVWTGVILVVVVIGLIIFGIVKMIR
jgi:hypothetical protein